MPHAPGAACYFRVSAIFGPTSKFTFEDLDDAEFRILCLALDMKAYCTDLAEFLARRKSRRARSKMLRNPSPKECR